MEKRFNQFSVPLGLLDYINPICYSITMITIIRNLYSVMDQPFKIIFLIGTIISVFFGLIIPTGKVLVGLGLIKFRMPVSLVFCVNSGILLSDLILFQYVLKLNLIVLLILFVLIVAILSLFYAKQKRFNTVAVLTGAAGYLLLYTALITLSIQKGVVLPIILYALAIMLFVMLCGIGIRGNLKDPKTHWIIEGSNVLCQALVAIGTITLFR